MLKLIGALLLTGGGFVLGMAASGTLADRVRGLSALTAALELLERELSFRLPPMPDLLEGLARRAPAPADRFFAKCAKGLDELGEKPFDQIWSEALSGAPMGLNAEDAALLGELGGVLGRYDGEGQRQAVAQTRARLTERLQEARDERRRQGRVYGTLGTALGAFCTILLL